MSYETYSSYILHGNMKNLSPYYEAFPLEIPSSEKKKFAVSAQEFHRFFKDWYQDMYDYPNCYGLPLDIYPAEAEQWERETWEYLAVDEKHGLEADKKYLFTHSFLKSKARNAINIVCSFIFRLGEQSVFENNYLIFDKDSWNKCIKKAHQPKVINRMGLLYETSENKVKLTNYLYPDMFFAFHSFSKACVNNKKLRFMFCRCDFRVFLPNFKWELKDVIYPLPEAEQVMLIELDSYLKALKYRRVIEFEGRYAYALKQGVIFRVELEYDRYDMYFRWPLKGDLSGSFFNKLNEIDQNLCQFVFNSMMKCKPGCMPGYGSTGPQNCGARVKIQYNSQLAYTCIDAGLPVLEHTKDDFNNIKTIASVIRKVFEES